MDVYEVGGRKKKGGREEFDGPGVRGVFLLPFFFFRGKSPDKTPACAGRGGPDCDMDMDCTRFGGRRKGGRKEFDYAGIQGVFVN